MKEINSTEDGECSKGKNAARGALEEAGALEGVEEEVKKLRSSETLGR